MLMISMLGSMRPRAATAGGNESGVEPIGERIIETPENTHETEFLRNPRSGFIAYVPPGSLKKGEALVINGVTSDGNKVTACTVCHGGDPERLEFGKLPLRRPAPRMHY
jgi:cytochrome c553